VATCAQCGTAVTEGATFCPVCGTPTAAADAPPTEAAAAPPVGGFGASSTAPPGGFGTQVGPTTGRTMPAFQFNTNNMSTFDWAGGVGTLLLFIFLFLPWYSVSGNNGLGANVSLSGSAIDHGYMYLTLIFCLALIAYYVAKLGWGKLPFNLPFPETYLVIGLSAVNLLLVIIAFFSKQVCYAGLCGSGSGIGWSFGAFLGLLAAIAAMGPAVPFVQQLQAKK
jgi:hypothetical protein